MTEAKPTAATYKPYLENVPCNLCAESNTKLWAVCDNFHIVQCKHCGLIYVNPRLNAKGLQKAYGSNYYTIRTERDVLDKRLKMYDIEIRELERLKSSGDIIDVGCGGGYFLARLGSHWIKFGTECNPVAAEEGRKNFGLDIQVAKLSDLQYPDNFFDVVNLRGTLEHFPDPYEYLAESYRILKEGGIIAINTPNIGSFCARLYREKFNMIDPVHHIYYFSVKTLTKMLNKVGFKVIHKRFFYLDTPYVKWNDFFKINFDSLRIFANSASNVKSPAFFGNIMHIYAKK